MNIKSLLLGSAAALVAVSGARAADAVVVAEPEPMEYVRICDTYGAGFYYIPGTETCLRISGLIRYDIDYSNEDDVIVTTTTPVVTTPVFAPADAAAIAAGAPAAGFTPIGSTVTGGVTTTTVTSTALDDGWAKTAYGRVNFDARSETEFGTFRRFIRFEASVPSGSDSGDVSMPYAYIELGGLLVGLYDTLFDADMSLEFDRAGGNSTHQIRYTFSGGNGISAAVSIEENDYNLDYTPNVVFNVGITQGWGNVRGFVAYDATAEEWAAKAITAFNVSDAILLEAMAQYESGLSMFSIYRGYEFTVGGAVSFKATDKLSLGIGAQGFFNDHITGNDEYRIGGQVQYNIVENLLARVTVNYNGGDRDDFWNGKFRLESAF